MHRPFPTLITSTVVCPPKVSAWASKRVLFLILCCILGHIHEVRPIYRAFPGTGFGPRDHIPPDGVTAGLQGIVCTTSGNHGTGRCFVRDLASAILSGTTCSQDGTQGTFLYGIGPPGRDATTSRFDGVACAISDHRGTPRAGCSHDETLRDTRGILDRSRRCYPASNVLLSMLQYAGRGRA